MRATRCGCPGPGGAQAAAPGRASRTCAGPDHGGSTADHVDRGTGGDVRHGLARTARGIRAHASSRRADRPPRRIARRLRLGPAGRSVLDGRRALRERCAGPPARPRPGRARRRLLHHRRRARADAPVAGPPGLPGGHAHAEHGDGLRDAQRRGGPGDRAPGRAARRAGRRRARGRLQPGRAVRQGPRDGPGLRHPVAGDAGITVRPVPGRARRGRAGPRGDRGRHPRAAEPRHLELPGRVLLRRVPRRLRDPLPVPFTSIYSRQDRLVPWRASVDDDARNVEITGSHLDLVESWASRSAVARALARHARSAGAGRGRDGRVRRVAAG